MNRTWQAPDGNAARRGLQMADENTWEQIVAQLEKHVESAVARQHMTAQVRSQAASRVAAPSAVRQTAVAWNAKTRS